jgi:hypothetical protein
MAEHDHTHVMDTTCKNCDSDNHFKVTHAHPDGHIPHQHRQEGQKLIRLENEPEIRETENEPPGPGKNPPVKREDWTLGLDED